MSFSAKLMLIITDTIITLITLYFFWKVLKLPPKDNFS